MSTALPNPNVQLPKKNVQLPKRSVQLPKRSVQLPKRSATRKPLAMKAQKPTVVLRQIAPIKRRPKTKILLD